VIHESVAATGFPWFASHGMSKYVHPDRTQGHKLRNTHSMHWYFSRQESGFYVVNMDPNYWKQVVHQSLMIRPLTASGDVAPGAITLFGQDPREHEEWAAMILAEQFVRTFKAGSGWSEKWDKRSKMNHHLDTLYGCLCAADVADAAAEETTEDEPHEPEAISSIRQPRWRS
jgi:hypothetical protein